MARILIVDQDEHARALLAAAAAEHEADVHVCADGLAALQDLRDNPGCDLLIIDLHTPRLDGLQLLRIMSQDPRLTRTPVVVTSGSAGHSDVNRAYAAGATGFLAKPFGSQVARSLLEEQLGVGLAAMV